MNDDVPVVSWTFVRGVLLGLLLGIGLWALIIAALVKLFGRWP